MRLYGKGGLISYDDRQNILKDLADFDILFICQVAAARIIDLPGGKASSQYGNGSYLACATRYQKPNIRCGVHSPGQR